MRLPGHIDNGAAYVLDHDWFAGAAAPTCNADLEGLVGQSATGLEYWHDVNRYRQREEMQRRLVCRVGGERVERLPRDQRASSCSSSVTVINQLVAKRRQLD